MIEMLTRLRSELEIDLLYCTDRGAHIRLAQRISSLDSIITAHLESSSERDTADLCDTVLP